MSETFQKNNPGVVGPWRTDRYVPGVKVRVTAAELSTHLRTRAKRHAERADEKRKELPKLKEAVESIRPQLPPGVPMAMSKYANDYRFNGDDAVEQLEKDIQMHEAKAMKFLFVADHLFEHDYCLDQNDMIALELIR